MHAHSLRTDADAKNGHDANSLDNACTRAGVSGEYIHLPLPNGSASADQLTERAAIFEYEAGYSAARGRAALRGCNLMAGPSDDRA